MNRVVYIESWSDITRSLSEWELPTSSKESTIRKPYSHAFFQYCADRNIEGLAISASSSSPTSRAHSQRLGDRLRAVRLHRKARNGWLFRLEELLYFIRLRREINNFQPSRILIDSGVLSWFYLSFLTENAEIIPNLHNLPQTVAQPKSVFQRIIRWLDRKYWSTKVEIFLSISQAATDSSLLLAAPQKPKAIRYYANYNLPIISTVATRPTPARRFIFLYSGRIETSKGVFDAVNACENAARARPDVQISLRFAGSGGAINELRDTAKQVSRAVEIAILGPMAPEELAREYTEADILLVPSRPEFPEGFAQVLVEAILYGTPSIASNTVPAALEFPNSTLVFEGGNVNCFTATILSVIDHPGLIKNLRSEAEIYKQNLLEKSDRLSLYSAIAVLDEPGAATLAC